MSKQDLQRQENKKMIFIVAAILALFIGGSVVAFAKISSDINETEQQLQQRVNG